MTFTEPTALADDVREGKMERRKTKQGEGPEGDPVTIQVESPALNHCPQLTPGQTHAYSDDAEGLGGPQALPEPNKVNSCPAE